MLHELINMGNLWESPLKKVSRIKSAKPGEEFLHIEHRFPGTTIESRSCSEALARSDRLAKSLFP